MKLLYIFIAISGFGYIACGILDTLKEGVGKVTNFVTDDSSEETKDEKLRNVPDINDILANRTEDYCSFTKLEKKIEEIPDPEACKKMNERFKDNTNFNFINKFGEMFNLLSIGIGKLKFPNDKEKMDTIFFVGNTGSGKSTLVQILGGDNSKIYSIKPHEFSTDFIIKDDSKIGIDTVNSQTLYPELLTDHETNCVLCDNPGFRDTRSPVHEIIAVYGMRKILQHTKKIKIVIVSTHASLKVGMYRDDFPNLLKHVTDFFPDIDKYKDSVYLIGTKAENTFIMVGEDIKVVPDSSIISGTAHFLTEVRSSFNDKNNKFNITVENKDKFVKGAIKILDSLLEKNNNIYTKISIVKRPMQEGPLSKIKMIQNERRDIRQKLLSSENMVDVKQGDFGFPLTDSAKNYLNEIFEQMNSYVTKLSEIIGEYITSHYANFVHSNTDINDVNVFLRKIKENVRKLSNEIGESKNPGHYANLISNFSEQHKLNLECLTTFKNISTLNEYLINLEDLTENTKYSPMSWNTSMKRLVDFIDVKVEHYVLLNDIFQLTTTYKFQKNRHSSPWLQENIYENNFIDFLDKNNLKSRYGLISADKILIENVNRILKIALEHKENVICQDEVLFFIDYFILLSEIKSESFEMCRNASKIVILALHTLFIDSDLTNEFYAGKKLTIISPIWDVIGTRTISVDGMSGGHKLPKAGSGEIGKYGKNGKPGGIFFGIGMNFNNEENLKISASGGDGQDGQDGGDGKDGEIGSHASENHAVHQGSKPTIYVLVNWNEETSIASGSSGGSGGNAGAGGAGGYGGGKGFVTLHNIGQEQHEISIVVEDGKRGNTGKDGTPGKGGIKGCDKKITKTTTYILFIPVGTSQNSDFVNCQEELPGGTVKRSEQVPVFENNTISQNDSPVCVDIMKFQEYYIQEYHPLISDGRTKTFINTMKSTKY